MDRECVRERSSKREEKKTVSNLNCVHVVFSDDDFDGCVGDGYG